MKSIRLATLGILFLLALSFTSAQFSNPSSSSSFSGNYQAFQPSFNKVYSGSQMSEFWPILSNMENDQCDATTDFVIGIPPGGCTPMVVRSDLLAEQNVPVFCQLYALKVNPLIKVSSIKSISFKGEKPDGVAGISYHPARAAVRSYQTLLGDPVEDNIGYVVIILAREKVEDNMEEWVAGNLTATIHYDAEKAYGVGRTEFYAPVMSDSDWKSDYKRYSFWQGRGYVRVSSIDRNSATVQILSDEDKVLQSYILNEGETSPSSYMPGFYCRAGLKVKLNSLETPEDSALLNVDGNDLWVRQGSKFLNDACRVSSIKIDTEKTTTSSAPTTNTGPSTEGDWPEKISGFYNKTTAEVDIGRGMRPLSIKFLDTVNYKLDNEDVEGYKLTFKESNTEKSVNYYLDKEAIENEGPITLYKESYINRASSQNTNSEPENNVKKLDTGEVRISCPGKTLTLKLKKVNNSAEYSSEAKYSDYELEDAFSKGTETVNELVDMYPLADKGGNLGTYGEEALYEQIILAERAGKFQTAGDLVKLFLEEYPNSNIANDLIIRQERIGNFEMKEAIDGAFINGKFVTIGLHSIKATDDSKKAEVSMAVRGYGIKKLTEGQRFSLGSKEYLIVRKIFPNKITLDYINENDNANKSRESKTVYEGDRVEIGPALDVTLDTIDVEELAHISLIPEVKNTKTEANFTFRIGIEQRAIKLSPEKTKEMIENINNTINDLRDLNKKLEKIIKGWKGACFATSALLVVKNMIDGFDGTTLARQKVMEKFRAICDEEYGPGSRDQCYLDKAGEIDAEVERMKNAMTKVNQRIDQSLAGNVRDGGLFGTDSVIDEEKHQQNLRNQLGETEIEVDGIKLKASDLDSTSQLRSALLYKEFEGQEGISADIAREEAIEALRNAAATKKVKDSESQREAAAKNIGEGIKIQAMIDPNLEIFDWSGNTLKQVGNKAGISDSVDSKIQIIDRGQNRYLLVLDENSKNQNTGVKKAYISTGSGWSETDATPFKAFAFDTSTIYDSNGNSKKGLCFGPWPKGTARVSYYETGSNKGLPAIVPFDMDRGLYAMVPNSGGTFIEDVPQGYTASADVNYFKICSIGSNGVMQNGRGDDRCQSFSINTASEIKDFAPCPEPMTEGDIRRVYNNAREAIRQASGQYGSKSVKILDELMAIGEPMSSQATGFECQDFMSPEECNIMFNVCDPVICPPSRCDFGGEYPVADVVQSGIIGSIVLCLPNFKEGIYVPICVTGIHAGLDAYTSILESERKCLEHSLETGEMVGICDEITAIYKCEFFWRQLSPLMKMALPKILGGILGQGEGTRGGGEYLMAEHAWAATEKSVDYFRNTYAENAFRAFNLRNVEEAGSTFCKGFVGTSFPTSADAIDSLLAPQSPAQFYAYFSETPFTDATVPATSHYKVYYHIYAGNEIGTQYRVYLKNPPASSYYQTSGTIPVDTGYIVKGDAVDEAKDFTAPAGYKELCVAIGSQEECGFRQVSTDFAIDYLSDKYVDEQAKKEVTSEKECISGSPSALPLIAPNIQAGVEEAVQPDISLRGIVRVCATNNPDGSPANSAKWKEVGDCGEPGLKCWLNLDSVGEEMSNVAALEGDISPKMAEAFGIYSGETSCAQVQTKLMQLNNNGKATYNEVRSYLRIGGSGELNCDEIASAVVYLKENQAGIKDVNTGRLQTAQKTLQEVETILSKARQQIKELKPIDIGTKTQSIINALEEISGTGGVQGLEGSGSNSQRAEAMALKATVYRYIVQAKLNDAIPINIAPRPGEEATTGQTTSMGSNEDYSISNYYTSDYSGSGVSESYDYSGLNDYNEASEIIPESVHDEIRQTQKITDGSGNVVDERFSPSGYHEATHTINRRFGNGQLISVGQNSQGDYEMIFVDRPSITQGTVAKYIPMALTTSPRSRMENYFASGRMYYNRDCLSTLDEFSAYYSGFKHDFNNPSQTFAMRPKEDTMEGAYEFAMFTASALVALKSEDPDGWDSGKYSSYGEAAKILIERTMADIATVYNDPTYSPLRSQTLPQLLRRWEVENIPEIVKLRETLDEIYGSGWTTKTLPF